MLEPKKLVAWAHDDPSTGGGTFNATFEFDGTDEDIAFVKEELAKVLSAVWDVAPRFVHVSTPEELADDPDQSGD